MKDHSEHSTPTFRSRAGHVRKATLAVITAVCLICSLSACDSKISEKTEDQISDDIQQQDIYFSTYNLNLDSFSVSKRQTNMEDKEDFVWCTIAASNDIFPIQQNTNCCMFFTMMAGFWRSVLKTIHR